VFMFFVFVAQLKSPVQPVVIFVQSHFYPLSVHLMSPVPQVSFLTHSFLLRSLMAHLSPVPHPSTTKVGSHFVTPAQALPSLAQSGVAIHLFNFSAGAVAQLVKPALHVDPSVLVESHVAPTSVQVTSPVLQEVFGTHVLRLASLVAQLKSVVHDDVICVQSHFCPLSLHLI